MPPPNAHVASARWSQRSERQAETGAAYFSALMDKALAAPECSHLGTRSLQRLVRRFISSRTHERDLVSWLISYADPTGETAVRNVMSARR